MVEPQHSWLQGVRTICARAELLFSKVNNTSIVMYIKINKININVRVLWCIVPQGIRLEESMNCTLSSMLKVAEEE